MHSDQPGRFSIPGSGLERPEAAQKQKQPNEPSLWVRFWLEQFLGCFWFSIPVPKKYRIFETKSVTKSEINCEHDLDEVRLARHLSQAPDHRQPLKLKGRHSSTVKLSVVIER